MLDFDTQEQVLNYLGKRNDRNLIKRMIRGGKLYKEDGRYFLVEEKSDQPNAEDFANTAKVLELSGEIQRLKEENEALKEMMNKSETSEGNPSELEEAVAQWQYYEDVANKRGKLMEAVIHETYVIVKAKLGNKMEDEKEFRSNILARARENIN